jgi:hypothetical protein
VKPFRVFLSHPIVLHKDRSLGHRAQWITRGYGSVLYSSKVCATREGAEKLARAWLAKHLDRAVEAP